MSTWSGNVAASNQDGRERADTGACVVTSSSIVMGTTSANGLWAATLWQTTIPQGVTISAASIRVHTPTGASGSGLTINQTIYGEAADSAANYGTAIHNLSGRARTTASVNWNPGGTTTSDTDYTTPDISSIIQEIVNRAGFGGTISILQNCLTGGNFAFLAQDSSSSQCAFLTVTYPTAGVPGAPTNLEVAIISSSSLRLDWAAPSSDGGSSITGYRIDRESPIGGGFSTVVPTTGSSSTTYTDTGLSAGTQYHYEVYAINANGTGPSDTLPIIQDYATTPVGIPPTSGSAFGIDGPFGWRRKMSRVEGVRFVYRALRRIANAARGVGIPGGPHWSSV